MKNKILLTIVLVLTLACLFTIGISAKALYLEEIPDELRIEGDTVTHFLVIDGEEYYGGSGSTMNAFKSDVIAAAIEDLAKEGGALNKLGYTASDLGTKFLTKLVLPATLNGQTITTADINGDENFKKNTYFRNCGYLVYPSSTTKTNDANQCNGQIRCIDFGENSQLTQIPYCYMQNAPKLIRLLNIPKNLESIDENAFRGCGRLEGDENGQLYISAKTVKTKAFDNAMANVRSIVFGENLQTLHNQSFSNGETSSPLVTYIEFKCDVTKVSFPANSTTSSYVGAFYFGKNDSQRLPYSNLVCIILSNPAQADCDGKTFREVSGQDVFFNDITGEDDFVYTAHAMVSINGCFESCSRCNLTQLKKDATHQSTYSFYNENGGVVSYLGKIVVNYECSVCGSKAVYETIDAIFVNLGYSVEENATEGAVSHKVRINRTSLARYEELTGKSLRFGVVAGIEKEGTTGDIITYENEEYKAAANAIMADFSKSDFSIIELKLTKIDRNVSVYCNAYVADGASITYMCGDNESTKAVAQPIKLKA